MHERDAHGCVGQRQLKAENDQRGVGQNCDVSAPTSTAEEIRVASGSAAVTYAVRGI